MFLFKVRIIMVCSYDMVTAYTVSLASVLQKGFDAHRTPKGAEVVGVMRASDQEDAVRVLKEKMFKKQISSTRLPSIREFDTNFVVDIELVTKFTYSMIDGEGSIEVQNPEPGMDVLHDTAAYCDKQIGFNNKKQIGGN